MFPDAPSLRLAVFRALQAALSLSPEEASHHIVRAYADPPPTEPAPTENVVYYHLATDPGLSDLRESSIENAVPLVSSFIPCRLTLVFYGSSCEAWACRAADFLFLDGHGKPRQILQSVGLYLIPSSPIPSVLHEESGKTFRKRADLVLRARLLSNEFYASVLDPASPIPVSTITSPPSVSVHLSREVTIQS